MEFVSNQYTLNLTDGFPLSTDSMVLADFVRLPRNAAVLDLGSGCGTLGLLLCANSNSCTVTGLELDGKAHEAALENIARNDLCRRLYSICADLRTMPLSPGSFSVCVSNPPYFSGGPASKALPTARREDFCSPADLFGAAAFALKFGGDFFLVHKPERLAELIAAGAARNLEAKRLGLLRHRAEGPVNLILLQLRKGAKPGLLLEDLILHNADGSPTALYQQIYHLQEA